MSTTAAKLAYYRGGGIKPALARRYYRLFEGARSVLDVGCGTGSFALHRPDPAIEVFGVDHDPGAVAAARELQRVFCVDLEREPLPFDDDSFDAVLAKDVLEHLDEPAPVVRELYRVLRPGGVLVASVVMAIPKRVWADYTHVRGFTRPAARLLLEDAGFTVEDVWRMGGVPLADRLDLIDAVPTLLRLPVVSRLWAASWELKARRPR